MDDASMRQRQGYDDDLDYENQSNFNDQNEHQNENRESWHIDNGYDVSSLLRQRVDELREALNLLQQNQAVALLGCLEQLLQATMQELTAQELACLCLPIPDPTALSLTSPIPHSLSSFYPISAAFTDPVCFNASTSLSDLTIKFDTACSNTIPTNIRVKGFQRYL